MKQMLRAEAGFTLVETLLGLALSSLLLVFVIGGIRIAQRAFNQGQAMERQDALNAAASAILRQIGRATDATFADSHSVLHLAFDGGSQQLAFVALSDASTQTGGLLATQIRTGKGAAQTSLVLSASVFSPAQPFGPEAEDNASTQVLKGVKAIEFLYFGTKEAGQPAQWYSGWRDAAQLPLLVSVTMEMLDRPGERAGPWLVRLRQKL